MANQLSLAVLEQALVDWSLPYNHEFNVYNNYTDNGLCFYFDHNFNINFYEENINNVPWGKYATVIDVDVFYHFNGRGSEDTGRAERVAAIKGMINDLKNNI